MTLFNKQHLWFIRVLTRQVELVQNQLEINKVLNRIKGNIDMIGVPRLFVDKQKPKKRRKA